MFDMPALAHSPAKNWGGGVISVNIKITIIRTQINTITLDSTQTVSENENFFSVLVRMSVTCILGDHDLLGAPPRCATFKNGLLFYKEQNRTPNLVSVTPASNVYRTIGSAAVILCFTSHKSKGTKAKCLALSHPARGERGRGYEVGLR